jgi:predicted HicB family RNase H-like nuclease
MALDETAPAATIYGRVPRSLKDRLEAKAKGEGVSLNTWVMRCVERCAWHDYEPAA